MFFISFELNMILGIDEIFHFICPNLEDVFEFEFSIDNDKNIEKLPQTEILEFLFFHNTNMV